MPRGASEAPAPCVDPSRSRQSLRGALRGWKVEIRSRLGEQGITIIAGDANRGRGLHEPFPCSAPQTGLEPPPDRGLYWASGGAVLGNYP